MSLTFHYLNSDFKRKNLFLSTCPFSFTHSSNNIQDKFFEEIEKWSIDPKTSIAAVVHDNAVNMKAVYDTINEHEEMANELEEENSLF